ncbi:hypothetical protein ACFE04_001760 [Oxalis oulophora]
MAARVVRNSIATTHHTLLTRFLNSLSTIGNNRYLTTTTSTQQQTLAYEEIQSTTTTQQQEEEPQKHSTALVLHGLLGTGRNWRSFSRNLVSYLSNSSPQSKWRFVLVDLRNHGRSAEIEELNKSLPHDLVNSANDLANLIKFDQLDWPDVVIGHSLGGKVAMQFALSCARGDYGHSAAIPKQLWVLDSIPGEVKPENTDGEVEKVLKTLKSLPSTIPSRKWLVNHMIELGFSKSLSEWIGSNLKKSGDHETWSFNLDGAFQMFKSYGELSYWPLLENPPKGMEIELVQAEKSDRWDPDTIQRLETLANRRGSESEGKVSLHVLPNAGHWVHVDNPKGLLDIMAPKIASL